MLKWIEIDLGIITENAKIIKKALNPGVKFVAAVKANGYGHGAAETACAAIAGGADRLAVLTAEEGSALRTALPEKYSGAEIMLLAPSLPEEADIIIKNRLIPCADSLEFLAELDEAAKKHYEIFKTDNLLLKTDKEKKRNNDIFLNKDNEPFKADKAVSEQYPFTAETDMGMGRWGVPPESLTDFLRKACALRNIRLAGIGTHLGYKPPQNMTDAEEKLRIFAALAKAAAAICGHEIEAAAANSSVFCDLAGSQFGAVRIGNLLYGIYPTDIYKKKRQGPPLPGLRRPWQFFAKIISIKNIKKGEKLGYNCEFTAPKDMRIAAIPAGYSDGLTMEPMEYKIRLVSGFRYWGIINGKKAYFIGKPGISHTLLDVSDIPEAAIGTPVSLHIRRTSANILIPRKYINQ